MAAYDDLSGLPVTSMVRSSDYTIDNNLFDDLSANEYAPGAFAVCFQITGPPSNLKVSNNTCQYPAGELRQPLGLWLVGPTDLWGTTFTNNNFNTELGGDGRYGPDVLRVTPNTSDPQYPLDSQLATPPAFAANNVILEGNPVWQGQWQQTVPGILFSAGSTSGADVTSLLSMEANVKSGTY
jgi:hypothetical protein